MIRLFLSGKDDELPHVWSALKTAAAHVLSDEKQFDHLLYELVAMALYDILNKEPYLDDVRKLSHYFLFPETLIPMTAIGSKPKISRLLL
jgi:hypothetical protein